jgi:transglutaminase-like putative cysteine protease
VRITEQRKQAMLYSINHTTKLDYSQPISESVMEVRAMPRTDDRQVLRQFDISVAPTCKANHHTDWLGNTVHQFSVTGIHDQVEITSKCVVETRPYDRALSEFGAPLEGLIRDHRSWDYLQYEGPVVDDPALPALSERLGLDKARRVGDAIAIVLERTRDIITYRRGMTSSSSTVSDVLLAGNGVCQDFAHLGLALLRRVGVPCRYVSGYLHRAEAQDLETHAWVEAFVPGVGWVAFDPTHGTLADENHITVAVGRSYMDVPPNRGVYRGDARESIAVNVVIQALQERPRLTPYSTSFERARSAPPLLSRAKEQKIVIGLEQQLTRSNRMTAVVQQQRQQQQ